MPEDGCQVSLMRTRKNSIDPSTNITNLDMEMLNTHLGNGSIAHHPARPQVCKLAFKKQIKRCKRSIQVYWEKRYFYGIPTEEVTD